MDEQKTLHVPLMANHNGINCKPDVLLINVGGRSARLPKYLLMKRDPMTRLAVFCSKPHADRIHDCDAYFEKTKEYYFERSPVMFEYIIDFYVTGKLHRPADVCPMRLRYELEFWRIPIRLMATCCKFDNDTHDLSRPLRSYSVSEQLYLELSCPPALFEKLWLGKLRHTVWTTFENPRSSSFAKFLSLLSATFVLLSLADLILSSMPEFQDEHMEPKQPLIYFEICCMLWFTFEYVCRFAVTPKRCEFLKTPLNIIDLLTILPFYMEACLPLIGFVNTVDLRNLRGAMVVIRVLRLARVARIFKLARYSTGLRAFGDTMRQSAAELSMLGMFLVTGIMLFSTAIYFFERDEKNSKFYSIPAACWWCVITMTTVGYGDLVPATPGGKVVAALASICGIIVLAFPISMIIDKFAESTTIWVKNDDENIVCGKERSSRQTRRKPRRYLT
ncbi:hypothetical protein AB6A40_006232 [Gnathostoma spinigerum]|uniref:BTB domain-containing protein n=1 Tax=Gnathostoma spinigerum TaxID=75299 RepID=A0ABD6EHT2_9BILA